MSYGLHSMEGYRRPTPQRSSSALSGCHHLRCKAFTVTMLGILFIIGYVFGSNTALLIVGIFIVIIGAALFFMDIVARNLGKTDPGSGLGRGMNISFNRVRRRRQRRLRPYHRDHQHPSSISPPISSSMSSSGHGDEDDDGGPPEYELSMGVQDLTRFPESSDWTFLPSEPPPMYFPPITSIDSHTANTNRREEELGEGEMQSDQSERPIYSISRQVSVLTFTLPSYEEACTNEGPSAEIPSTPAPTINTG